MQQPLADLPNTDAAGKATFPVSSTSCRELTPAGGQMTVRMAEPGGRAVERKITLPVTPTAT